MMMAQRVGNNEQLVFLNINSFKSNQHYLELFLNDQQPAVVALVETKIYKQEPPNITRYQHHYFEARTENCGGISILTRNDVQHKIIVTESVAIEQHRQKIKSSTSTKSVLVNMNGKEVLIIVVYRQSSGTRAKQQTEWQEILTEIQSLINRYTDVIIVGDFNAHHMYWNCKRTTTDGNTLLDFVIDNNLTIINNINGIAAPTRTNNTSVIDLAITNAPNIISSMIVTSQLATDHYALVINLKLEQVAEVENQFTHKITRWKTLNADWERYRDNLHPKLLELHDEMKTTERNHDRTTNMNTINVFWERLTKQIHDTAAATIGTVQNNINNKKSRYWADDANIRTLAATVRRMKRRYVRNKERLDNKIKYYAYKKLLKHKIREHKNKSWDQLCENINQSSKQANWKKYHQSLKRKVTPPTSITDVNGTLPTTLHQSLNNMADFFEQVYQPLPSTIAAHDMINNGVSRLKEQLQQHNIPHNELNFFSEEIEDAAKSIKKTTSAGPDNITMPLILEAGTILYDTLQQLFLLINKLGIVPNGMKLSRSIAIFKNKGTKNEPKNYRIISITSVIARIWEKLIHKKLLIAIGSQIPAHQHGFMPTRGTYDAIFQLQQQIETSKRNKQQLTIFFGDITTAYDRVWQEGLITQLLIMNVPKSILKLLISFIEGRSFFIQYSNKKSKTKYSKAGVPQGCILSPLLFIIYMKTIERFILPGFRLILFADDICIFNMAKMSKVQYRKQMSKLDKWTEMYKFILSIEKSAQMNMITNNNSNNNNVVLKINEQTIPTIQEFKYLGIVFSCDGSWKKHVDYVTKKIQNIVYTINRLIKPHLNTPTPRVLRNMLLTLAYSVIRYANPFYNITAVQAKKIESIITMPIRKLLRLPRHTRHRAILFEMELPHIQTIKQNDTLNFYNKHLQKRTRSKELDIIKDVNNKNRWIQYLKQTMNKWQFNDENINKRNIKQQHKIREEIDFKQQLTIPSLLKYNTEYKFPEYLYYDKFPVLQTRARLRLSRSYIHEHNFNHNSNPQNCPLCDESRDTVSHLLLCPALTHFITSATDQIQAITPNKRITINTLLSKKEKKYKKYLPITNELITNIITRRKI